MDLLRAVARQDAELAAEADASAALVEAERARGYDRGARVLYVTGSGHRLDLRNLGYSIRDEDDREVIGLSATRVDRIELDQGADASFEALKLALGHGATVAVVTGGGETLGLLAPPGSTERAGLHLAQAAAIADPERAADIARALVRARLHGQRSQLHRLNRGPKDPDVIAATRTLGRMLRKLPHAGDVAALRGHEGAAAAVYWPALGRLAAGAPQPFRRRRPATDPLNAAINYLTALLARDVRTGLVRRGLHPGFGVLHAVSDRSEAAVWDLMEPFRAPLSEGLAATLFNQSRLLPEMFAVNADGLRIAREGRRALIRGYESAMGRLVTNPRASRKRTWRALIEDEATAYGRHCLDPATPYEPFLLDH